MSYVLVVDDDAPIGRLIKMVLTSEGMRCEVSPTADEGLELLRLAEPELIILDLRLAGMDAPTFMTSARDAGYAGPILLCTAVTGEPPIVADGLIKKPFRPEDLVEKVRELIGE
ncbi:MAG: response regulator [Dehalococcoidia bacterium]|nr:response regulator [Dehalococcoidia bacterium]